MIKIQTLKGFRDFLPEVARKRQFVVSTLQQVFTSFGFEPLETPALEYQEILNGKYGAEGDKLMYTFKDHGDRLVAMRYDQTVPLARVVGQYGSLLPMPFKRYQISNVWRAENTQKGRYREFVQCDIDTVGTNAVLSDAEIIMVVSTAYHSLRFKNMRILVNDRTIFHELPVKAVTIIDKLEKIGKDGVIEELVANAVCRSSEEAASLFQKIMNKPPTPYLISVMSHAVAMGVPKSQIQYSPTLARGLDYYTGLIFEIVCDDYPFGSLGGGGRYDNLIGLFAPTNIPAVGFAFGFDRTIEALETLHLFPKEFAGKTKVLVTIFSEQLQKASIDLANTLRAEDINTEVYIGDLKRKNSLEKQLKYADLRQIPFVAILGEEEKKQGTVIIKDMETRQQEVISINSLGDILKK